MNVVIADLKSIVSIGRRLDHKATKIIFPFEKQREDSVVYFKCKDLNFYRPLGDDNGLVVTRELTEESGTYTAQLAEYSIIDDVLTYERNEQTFRIRVGKSVDDGEDRIVDDPEFPSVYAELKNDINNVERLLALLSGQVDTLKDSLAKVNNYDIFVEGSALHISKLDEGE